MKFIYNDGGRKAAGYDGSARDCVVRAIAIALEQPYQRVYDDLFDLNKIRNKPGEDATPRNGNTGMPTIREYLASAYGWLWTPTMHIGSGCKVHLADGELPQGRLIVRVSKHLCAVIDGVIHDTHDPQRTTIIFEGGKQRIAGRCVYGYFTKGGV